MKETLKLMMSHKMLYALPLISWTGVSLAIYTAFLVPMISNTVPVPHRDDFEED